MEIISGKVLSKQLLEGLKNKLEELNDKLTLAVILVGQDPASQIYVRNKIRDCEKVGIISKSFYLDENTNEEELIKLIDSLNNDSTVHGVLVQLPLPKHINSNRVLDRIDPNKDVDGFHPLNVGMLSVGIDTLYPCTAVGIIELIKFSGTTIEGKKAVVIGRSNIVGKPVSRLLLMNNATVTVCHSKTPDLKSELKDADIVVVAAGKPNLINASYIKDGATVIDVGSNYDKDGKQCGDCDFASFENRDIKITPVPGGVGPMTRCMLMYNTYKAYLISKNGR